MHNDYGRGVSFWSIQNSQIIEDAYFIKTGPIFVSSSHLHLKDSDVAI